jgi:hypothetical protein
LKTGVAPGKEKGETPERKGMPAGGGVIKLDENGNVQ